MKRHDRALPGRLAVFLAATALLSACGGDGEDNKRYHVGGTVAGLAGTVVLQNQGVDDLVVTSPGRFTFATPIKVGRPYAVTVATQPAGQVCNVVHGTGNVSGEVTDVVVTCFDNATHELRGTVSGLAGTVILRNGTETLSVAADGGFVFINRIPEGAAYAVSVAAQPAGQTCSVANGSGTMPAADVTNVAVTCTNDPPPPATSYAVGGTVSGLGSGKTLQLGLRHSGDVTRAISVTANGAFNFDPERVATGQPYAVSVVTQPAGQTCSVANGSGTMPGAAVTNVAVTCADDPTPVVTYSIGGTVAGLATGAALQLRLQHAGSSGSTIDVTANGQFSFGADRVDAGDSYVVSILTQPSGQTCSITNGSGTATANVTNVSVACATTTVTYAVGGTISGLGGAGLRLEGGPAGAVTPEAGATGFTLPEELENGAAYDVGIATQPVGQTCLITRSQGAVASADVADIRVTCVDNVTSPLSGTYTVPAASASDTRYVYLTFFPDGVFIYAGIENTNGCGNSPDGNGIEYGVYDYDAATGAFSIKDVVVDTNGGCGVWHNNSRFDGTLVVSGAGQGTVLSLTLSSGGDVLFLVPVLSIPGQLFGSFADAYHRNFWLFLQASGGGVNFLNTETQADPGATSLDRVAGLEYACGALAGSPAGGTLSPDFSATCLAPAPGADGPVDTNGTAGLSNHAGAWEFSVVGDALTSSTFNGTRIVPD